VGFHWWRCGNNANAKCTRSVPSFSYWDYKQWEKSNVFSLIWVQQLPLLAVKLCSDKILQFFDGVPANTILWWYWNVRCCVFLIQITVIRILPVLILCKAFVSFCITSSYQTLPCDIATYCKTIIRSFCYTNLTVNGWCPLWFAHLTIVVLRSSYSFFSVRIMSPVPCAVKKLMLMKHRVIWSLLCWRYATWLSTLHFCEICVVDLRILMPVFDNVLMRIGKFFSAKLC